MPFTIESRPLGDAAVLVPSVFEDQRGFFMEAFRADQFRTLGLPDQFPQDNHSRSSKGVLRGLHFQWDPPMAKIMRVTVGTAYLVAVDIRKSSPTLGQWFGVEVSAQNRRQVFAPAGFARGFCVLSDFAELQYKCTGIYNPNAESGVLRNDPNIGIQCPVTDTIVSAIVTKAPTLQEWWNSPEADHFRY